MGNILSRIQKIATSEGITIGAMERSIGASKGVLSRAITNGTDIQSKWLQVMVDNYPRYSAEWLLTGRGEMLKGQPADRGEMLKGQPADRGETLKGQPADRGETLKEGPVGGPSSAGGQPGSAERLLSAHGEAQVGVRQGGPSSAAVSYGAPIDTTDRVSECGPSAGSFAPDIHVGTTATTPAPAGSSPAETSAHLISEATTSTAEGIPLVPTEAIAAALAGDLSVTATATCDRYVVPLFQDADFLIPVKGSSMHPHYSSGDIVACRRIPLADLFFQWGKVYVLLTPQGALVKRVKPGTDPAHVLIVSDNPSFDPFELPVASLRAVALVVGVLRQE